MCSSDLGSVIEWTVAAHGAQPLGEALATYGVRLAPDFPAIAAASWPLVVAIVRTDAVGAWLAELLTEG